MGELTGIEYLDSSLNVGVGCDGCELWTKKPVLQPDGNMKLIRACYAGSMVRRYEGLPGWPKTFETPTLFLRRLLEAERWPDLRGTARLDKPWLNGLPRIIFLNDLGDTFTASFPEDWLITPSPEIGRRTPLEVLSGLAAIIAMFTKRPDRMLKLFRKVRCPDNIVPITSITGPETLYRARQVRLIESRWKGLSIEPLLKGLGDMVDLSWFDWWLVGFESGSQRRAHDIEDARTLLRQVREIPAHRRPRFFMKQIDKVTPIPKDLMVREVPDFTLGEGGLFGEQGLYRRAGL